MISIKHLYQALQVTGLYKLGSLVCSLSNDHVVYLGILHLLNPRTLPRVLLVLCNVKLLMLGIRGHQALEYLFRWADQTCSLFPVLLQEWRAQEIVEVLFLWHRFEV
jgi:hypothetical protein